MKGMCGDVLLQQRTVDEAPLVLFWFSERGDSEFLRAGTGTSLLAGRKDPGALRTGCGQAYQESVRPSELTVSHCHRWRDRCEVKLRTSSSSLILTV